MARKWSGFVAQNLATKEEWEMLEACEVAAKRVERVSDKVKPHQPRTLLKRRPALSVAKDK